MLAYIFALFILLFSPLPHAQGAVNSSGGQITPVSISIDRPLENWYFFYSTSGPSTSTLLPNGTNFSTPVSLGLTSGFYFISDSASPFTSSLSPANLSEFDLHFNLSGRESAYYLFNDTSAFNISAGISTPGGDLLLPTLYIAGALDEHAFRVGLAQAGANFIFVIPYSASVGKDGKYYNYQFFLPYSTGANFYVFSIVPPSNTTATVSNVGGAPSLSSLNYNWVYDGSMLTINTEPGTSISLSDSLGKSYNAKSDESGVARFEVLPGRYMIRLQKSGYSEVLDSIYLSAPNILQNKTEEKQPPPTVSITRSPEGVTVCLESDCYFQEVSQEDLTRLLSDISCNGSICTLLNITPTAFVQKHQLKRVISAGPQAASTPLASFNISALFGSLGRGLSERFGFASQNSSFANIAALSIVFGTIAISAYLVSKGMFSKPKPGSGYG
jgi:hypothetical protein